MLQRFGGEILHLEPEDRVPVVLETRSDRVFQRSPRRKLSSRGSAAGGSVIVSTASGAYIRTVGKHTVSKWKETHDMPPTGDAPVVRRLPEAPYPEFGLTRQGFEQGVQLLQKR